MSSSARSVWLVLGGIVSVQVGAAISKGLFDRADPTTIVWLRLASSAVILLAVARPRLTGRGRADWVVVLVFGATLALMNWSIYQSFARVPLGVAVTVELLGPLTLSLALSRRPLDLLWVLLAATGVVLLGLDAGAAASAAGIGFALLAGAAWAGYILLSAATGQRWPALDGLAVASVVGAVALAPAAWASGGGALSDPRVVFTGVLVGLLSSVVPYSLELAALRTLPAKVFGVLMSLEPAAAALAGLVLLGEHLGAVEWLAIGCVVAASAGVTKSTATEVGAPA
ncbi:MAG: inner rane transporter RhtA [Nocardioidaceae bacterium]|nr:inner rane transporter RhtA [Nocardioidaceae bacterium]